MRFYISCISRSLSQRNNTCFQNKHDSLELCYRCPAVLGSVRPWSSFSRPRSSYWQLDGLTGARARLSWCAHKNRQNKFSQHPSYIDCYIDYIYHSQKGDADRRSYGGCTGHLVEAVRVISSSPNTAKRQNLFKQHVMARHQCALIY